MTRRRGSKPLWADLPPDEPDPYADVSVQWTVEAEEEPEPSQAAVHEPSRRRGIVLSAAVLGAALLVAMAMPAGSFSVETVASGWGDIPMRCETARLDEGPRAVEAFRCRATDGSRLPPGRYELDHADWTSDITREPARASVVEISGDGELSGVATYGPR